MELTFQSLTFVRGKKKKQLYNFVYGHNLTLLNSQLVWWDISLPNQLITKNLSIYFIFEHSWWVKKDPNMLNVPFIQYIVTVPQKLSIYCWAYKIKLHSFISKEQLLQIRESCCWDGSPSSVWNNNQRFQL